MKVIITYGNKSLLESKKAFFDDSKEADTWKDLLTKFDNSYKMYKIERTPDNG